MQLARADIGSVVGTLTSLGARIGCHAAADTLRILAGRPLLGTDVDDASLPLEAGLAAAVNYRKGCYLGQEAIAMMTYRGQMRRHLCWVSAAPETPALGPGLVPMAGAGWALRTADGKRAGRMGSAVILRDGQSVGLAMVQRKAFAPNVELWATADDGSQARVRVLGTTAPGVFLATTTEAGA